MCMRSNLMTQRNKIAEYLNVKYAHISMSSQIVTMPYSIGYFSERNSRFDSASVPTYESRR